jgi:hypothetical protein
MGNKLTTVVSCFPLGSLTESTKLLVVDWTSTIAIKNTRWIMKYNKKKIQAFNNSDIDLPWMFSAMFYKKQMLVAELRVY